jgi:hypothetical protein
MGKKGLIVREESEKKRKGCFSFSFQIPPNIRTFQKLPNIATHQTLEPSIGHEVGVFFHLLPFPFI